MRALDLLEALNLQKVCSVAMLHETTGLPKSTIVRLLETLIKKGYVINDSRQGGYQVTSLVQSLSCGFHGDPLVVEAGRAWLIEFTRCYKWPVSIALYDYDAVVIRFSTIPDSPVSPFHTTINMRLPLLTRALGRAYLAFCAPDEQNIILDILAKSTHPEDSKAKKREEAVHMLNCIRKTGYAIRPQRIEPLSSSTLAVPIIYEEKVLATVGMTYFRSAISDIRMVEQFLDPLQRLAKNIVSTIARLDSQSSPL
jgi:Transcriptional regulator